MSNRRSCLGWIAAALAMAVGCRAPSSAGATPAARRLGVYRFSERVVAPGADAEVMDIEGEFVVLADTVTVDARPGPCRYDTRTTGAGPITYLCGEVTLTFDRQDPVERASYAVDMHARGTETVCIRYTTNAAGRQVCAQTANQVVDRKVRQSGRLRAIRGPSGA